MNRPSQNNRLAALMRRQWVTPLAAFRHAGTLRFSGRILELKRAGYTLREKWLRDHGARVKAFRIAP